MIEKVMRADDILFEYRFSESRFNNKIKEDV